jgi:CheY-like chemotaxis protein
MPKEAGPSVLVAENNPVERSLMCSLLESLGIFPDSAAHGREALDACRMRAYDLIFLECRMPVMDGFVAVAEIRAGEAGKGKRTYIVGMAEKAGEDWAGPGLPQGMDALIIKPVNLEAIRESLREAMGNRQNTRPD